MLACTATARKVPSAQFYALGVLFDVNITCNNSFQSDDPPTECTVSAGASSYLSSVNGFGTIVPQSASVVVPHLTPGAYKIGMRARIEVEQVIGYPNFFSGGSFVDYGGWVVTDRPKPGGSVELSVFSSIGTQTRTYSILTDAALAPFSRNVSPLMFSDSFSTDVLSYGSIGMKALDRMTMWTGKSTVEINGYSEGVIDGMTQNLPYGGPFVGVSGTAINIAVHHGSFYELWNGAWWLGGGAGVEWTYMGTSGSIPAGYVSSDIFGTVDCRRICNHRGTIQAVYSRGQQVFEQTHWAALRGVGTNRVPTMPAASVDRPTANSTANIVNDITAWYAQGTALPTIVPPTTVMPYMGTPGSYFYGAQSGGARFIGAALTAADSDTTAGHYAQFVFGPVHRDAYSFAIDQTLALEAFSSATGWSRGSIVGGYLQVVAAANDTAAKTYGTPLTTRAYRYLRLRVRSQLAGSTIEVTIAHSWTDAANAVYNGSYSKKYTIVCGAANTFTDVLIDLCSPDTHTPAVDPEVNGAPDISRELVNLSRGSGRRYIANSSTLPMWGVDYIKTLTFKFVTADTYDLDALDCYNYSGGGEMSSGQVGSVISGGLVDQCPLCFCIDSDGKRVMDMWKFMTDAQWLQGASPYISPFSPTLLKYWIELFAPGINVSLSSSLLAAYYEPQPSAFGATFDTAWRYWSRRQFAMRAFKTDAQLTTYPGLHVGMRQGDVASLLNYGTDSVSHCMYEGGGGWNGILLDSNGDPVSGVAVKPTTSASGAAPAQSDIGVGVSAALGFYSTVDPPAGGYYRYTNARVEVQTTGLPAATSQTNSVRCQNRICFADITVPTESGFHTCFSPPGLLHTLYEDGGALYVRNHSLRWPENTSAQIGSHTDVDHAQICWSPKGWLFAVWTRTGDGSVYYSQSTDFGRTWGTATAILTGDSPAVGCGGLNPSEFVAINDGSNWKFYKRDDGDLSWTYVADVAAFAANDSMTIEVAYAQDASIIAMHTTGGAINRLCSEDGGQSWSGGSVATGTRGMLALCRETEEEYLAFWDGTDWWVQSATTPGDVFGSPVKVIANPGDVKASIEVSSDATHRPVVIAQIGNSLVRYVSLDKGVSWVLE